MGWKPHRLKSTFTKGCNRFCGHWQLWNPPLVSLCSGLKCHELTGRALGSRPAPCAAAPKRDGAAQFCSRLPIISPQWCQRRWRGLGEHGLGAAHWCGVLGPTKSWSRSHPPKAQILTTKPWAPMFHSTDHFYIGVGSARFGQDFIPFKRHQHRCYISVQFTPAFLVKCQAISSFKALIILWFLLFWSPAAGQTLEWDWLAWS